ncbi:hypothetical protein [Jiulongibacter sp. NS-SX5]|uniref:hypothetical protein n=1 Tax=Jiulongibacter sp. NS-SX5 TaxID=3463854 RepID=UPI004059A230
MKKIYVSLLALWMVPVLSYAQKEEKLKIFKFDPLPLTTSALSFGVESFNAERTRSMDIHLGLRYKKDNSTYYYETPVGGEQLDPFTDWKGFQLTVARRFYVPAFKDRDPNIFNQETSQSGVYFAPSLRVDFNQNEYDQSRYVGQYKQETNTTEYILITDKGKTNYSAVMPALNFGVQFSLFQYGYIDLHVGGGIRFQSENTINKEFTGVNSSYYRSGDAINNFILKEGVQPTGGITFGLRL